MPKHLALLPLLLAGGGLGVSNVGSLPDHAVDPKSRLTVGGIAIGQSEASVVRMLGNPQQRNEDSDLFLPIRLAYPGLVVSLDEQGVGGVLSTSATFCTSARICPGMTYAQVAKAYGPADAYERDGAFFRDYLWDDGCWLRLGFQAEVVSSVETTCSP